MESISEVEGRRRRWWEAAVLSGQQPKIRACRLSVKWTGVELCINERAGLQKNRDIVMCTGVRREAIWNTCYMLRCFNVEEMKPTKIGTVQMFFFFLLLADPLFRKCAIVLMVTPL